MHNINTYKHFLHIFLYYNSVHKFLNILYNYIYIYFTILSSAKTHYTQNNVHLFRSSVSIPNHRWRIEERFGQFLRSGGNWAKPWVLPSTLACGSLTATRSFAGYIHNLLVTETALGVHWVFIGAGGGGWQGRVWITCRRVTRAIFRVGAHFVEALITVMMS